MQNPFKILTKFEWTLWALSALTVTLSFLLSPERDLLALAASLVGVSALIFVARGHLFGQVLIIVFALFYGMISLYFKFYGEMITYLGMSAPVAVGALITWAKHPYKKSAEVEVRRITKKEFLCVCLLALGVTVIFHFILRALGTAKLAVSTISIATSFFAAFLTVLRSPYYALAYAANDVVLVTLWLLAAIGDPSSIPMVVCFGTFLVNDIYAFISWCRMRRRQEAGAED